MAALPQVQAAYLGSTVSKLGPMRRALILPVVLAALAAGCGGSKPENARR